MPADHPVLARVTAPVGARGSPSTVVSAFSARRAVRSGVLWGAIFGTAIASSELSYVAFYRTMAQRQVLADTYGSSKAMAALFGPTSHLETVGGFTAFKVSMTLMVLGAVWGLLASTRLLRGEEDAGRWDLLVCGQTTRRGATAQALAGLAAGWVTVWVVTALIAIVSGHRSDVRIGAGQSLVFALATVCTAGMFLAVGAVTSQLASTSRQAASFAAVVLGLAYGLRLVADAGVGLHGLVWASPLGWVEELRALDSPRPLALVPIIVFTGAMAAVAVHLAGRRDVGSGIVADRTHAEAHLGLLAGPIGLAIRTLRATVVGWLVAIALSAFLYGLIARSAGTTIEGSIHDVLAKFGAAGGGTAAILGVCFLVEAVLVGFVAAGQVSAARAEEAEGRLEHLLVRPVSRARWLGGRLLVALSVLVLGGLAAGVSAWLGTASQHGGLGPWQLLGAGINLVPPALVVLGAGVLAFGARPRATPVVVYGLLGWSLLVVIVGGFGTVSHWVLDTSVFHHMASAPGVPPDWEANGIMAGIGLAGVVLGGFAFARRDLQGA